MSDERTEQIKMLTGCGLSQRQIADNLKIPLIKVSMIQRTEGINPRPRNYRVALSLPVIEKILELYATNGAPRIAKEIGIPVHQVYLVLRAKGAVRPEKRQGRGSTSRFVGAKYALASKRSAILDRRDAFERAIASEFKVSLGWVRTFLRRRRA